MLYDSRRRALPPAFVADVNGKPMHSWRTLILPELEEAQRYSQYQMDESWNSLSNLALTQFNLKLFHCPKDKSADKFDTSYVAIIGPHTAWQHGKGVRLRAIKDPSKTILLVELHNSGINWAEPRDLDLDNLPPGITKQNLLQSLSNHASDGCNAAFADGHVNFIQSTIPWKVFETLLSIDGDKTAANNY